MKKLFMALCFFASINLKAQVDNTFNSGGSGANNTINCLVLQPDNKILIAGLFVQFNITAKNRIIRLNANGTNDNTFSTGSGASDAIRVVVVQKDGKIILGGSFAQFNGVAKGKIVRLTSTGTIDNAFNSGGAGANASGVVYTLAIQTDGKILVGGSFVQFNTSAKGRILRLTTSGAIDIGFNSGGSGANTDVKAIKVQTDGKILVGGSFVQFNASTKGRILRLTTTGTIDPGFNSGGSGASSVVNTIALESNNKIILGGDFTQFNTSARTRIVRLSNIGAIDNTFNAGSGASSTINAIAAQANGGLIVAGSFVQFATSAVGRICRLSNSVQRLINNEEEALSNEFRIFPNPFTEKFEVTTPSNETSFCKVLIYQSNGVQIKSINISLSEKGYNKTLIDLSGYPSGIYFISIDNGKYWGTKKIIKL